jgi:23S rRNA (cytosine1962-C5)-methyltransferase
MNNAVDDIAKAIVYILPFIKTIYDKTEDKFFKRSSRFISGDKTDDIVTENGLKFYVNWVEGQKTGFFNDQRDNRKLLKGFCHRKRVLNLFSYSGGFSVYALQGEAEHVTSVDSSAKAQEWCEKNISLNPFSGSHKFQCSDVIEFLKSEKSIYNIIIVDPPAFAKHREAIDNASTGYRNLNYEAIKKIAKGGYIYTFSCSQVIDKELFRKIIFKAAAQSRRNIKIVHQLTQAPDHPVSIYHPEGEYLKGLVLYVE